MVAGRLKFRGILFTAVLVCSATFAARTASAAATNYFWNGNGPDSIWNDGSLDWSTSSGGTATEAWSDDSSSFDSTAIFAGTAGTVTLGTTVNAAAIDFNTTGYILAAPSPNTNNYQINLAGAAPAINVGTGNAAFTATINANVVSTSATAPLVLSDTATGAAAVNTQLNFGGSLTVNSGSFTLVQFHRERYRHSQHVHGECALAFAASVDVQFTGAQ